MHIVWGVLAGSLLGVVLGALVLLWQVEHADGRLVDW